MDARPRKKARRILILLSALSILACTEDRQAEGGRTLPTSAEEFVPLNGRFLTRATTALADRVSDDSEILEIRVSGHTFSLHMRAARDFPALEASKAIKAGRLVQLDYQERGGREGQPPIGKIFGPRLVATQGRGKIEDNVFPFSEVDLPAVARAFAIARLAIDPKEGKIERLVLRRNLPFGARVRGRIFVRSPRMSGSIDVNEKGTPLKR